MRFDGWVASAYQVLGVAEGDEGQLVMGKWADYLRVWIVEVGVSRYKVARLNQAGFWVVVVAAVPGHPSLGHLAWLFTGLHSTTEIFPLVGQFEDVFANQFLETPPPTTVHRPINP